MHQGSQAMARRLRVHKYNILTSVYQAFSYGPHAFMSALPTCKLCHAVLKDVLTAAWMRWLQLWRRIEDVYAYRASFESLAGSKGALYRWRASAGTCLRR